MNPQQTADESKAEDPLRLYLNPRYLWGVFRKRYYYIILCIFLTEAYYLYKAFNTPRLYPAYAKIAIQEDDSRLLSSPDPWSEFARFENYFETILTRINTQPVLNRVVKNLKANEWPEYAGGNPTAHIRGGIKVNSIPSTRLAMLSFEGPNAEHSVLIVNGLVEAFNQEFSQGRRSEASEQVKGFSDQILSSEEEIKRQQENLAAFIKEHGASAADPEQTAAAYELKEIANRQAKLRVDLFELDLRLKTLKDAQKSGNIAAVAAQADNKILAASQDQLRQLEREKRRLLQLYTENSPRIKAVQAEIEDLKREEAAQVDVLVTQSASEFERLSAFVDRLEKDKRELEKRLESNASLRMQFDQLKTRLNMAQTRHQDLLNGQDRGELFGHLPVKPLAMIEAPELIGWPSQPNFRKSVSTAFLMGLLYGVALCFLLEYLDQSIRSPVELEAQTGVVCLAVIPHLEGVSTDRERLTLAHARPNHPGSEMFKRLRASLSLIYPPKKDECQIALVCSSHPHEGKTTISANLAIVHAQSGKKVLMIEGDLRRPQHRNMFAESERGGPCLDEYLQGKVELDKAIRPSPVPNLDLAMVGHSIDSPAELLGTQRMKELIEYAKKNYQLIVLDSPPILSVADPLVLCAYADYMLMTIGGGITQRKQLMEALKILKQGQKPLAGLVLNDPRHNLQHEGEGYYPGYYSAYIKDHGEKSSRSKVGV